MITEKHGDIFQSTCSLLVNPVNCLGPMGAGLAKAFSVRFEGLEEAWKSQCAIGEVAPGATYLWGGKDTWVANMTTKEDWRNPSHLDWIAEGLESLQSEMHWNKLQSVAIPAVGCGLGGLRFEQVRELVYAQFEQEDLDVELYGPPG